MGKIVVYCQPGAKTTAFAGLHDGMPKIRLKAPALEGAANQALIVFLAKQLNVSKSAIEIEIGQTSRIKRLRVQGIDDVQLHKFFSSVGPV